MFNIHINPFKSRQDELVEVVTTLNNGDVIEFSPNGDLNNVLPGVVVCPSQNSWDANGKFRGEYAIVMTQGGIKKKVALENIVAVYVGMDVRSATVVVDANGNYRGMAATAEAVAA